MGELGWLEVDEHLVFRAFARSSRQLFVRLDRELQEAVGMPRTYFEILWLLNQAPEHSLRMTDLAEATGTQPSGITHAVGRLEEAGHVRRELCSSDRRGWFTVLTDDGFEALRTAAPSYAQSIRDHLLEPLSATQRVQLRRIGESILARLDDENDHPPQAKTEWPDGGAHE